MYDVASTALSIAEKYKSCSQLSAHALTGIPNKVHVRICRHVIGPSQAIASL
jgi:hypothetical protein